MTSCTVWPGGVHLPSCNIHRAVRSTVAGELLHVSHRRGHTAAAWGASCRDPARTAPYGARYGCASPSRSPVGIWGVRSSDTTELRAEPQVSGLGFFRSRARARCRRPPPRRGRAGHHGARAADRPVLRAATRAALRTGGQGRRHQLGVRARLGLAGVAGPLSRRSRRQAVKSRTNASCASVSTARSQYDARIHPVAASGGSPQRIARHASAVPVRPCAP